MRALYAAIAALFVLAACQPSAAPSAATATPQTKAAATQVAPSKPSPAANQSPVAGASPATKPSPASSPAANGAQSAEVARLVAAAKAANETELNLSWSQNTLGGSEGAKRIGGLMSRLYGVTVRVNFTPGPSMTNMAGKVVQEATAGQKASTDILLGGEGHYASIVDKQALEEYDYTKLSTRITREFLAPNNIGVEFASRVPGVTYNKNLVPAADVPKKLEDTLNPKWKGKIASTVNAASFDRVAARPDWTLDRMRTFTTQLSQQVAGLIRCGESARVISGEFAMLVMDCGSYEVRRQVVKGAPLGHVILDDAATLAFWYLGVPRTSEHPNLAKLFISAVMSEEGQKLLYELDATDHFALAGSQSVSELEGLRARGIELLRVDAKFVVEHPELDVLADELAKILREKG